MSLDKSSTLLPYPDRQSTFKCHPVQGDASVISSVTKLWLLDTLWIREGGDVTVKMLLAHDTPPISFESLEYRTICTNLDGNLSISIIQASATSRAGYLLGSRKTMNPRHWTPLLQAHPCFAKLDVHAV